MINSLTQLADDMDKRLLLTIQSECNAQSLNLPWNDIGHSMGEQISGGAVIQHLAKLRARMIDQGLAVPPPLKRGGSMRISTGPSLPARVRQPAPKANPSSSRATPAKKPNNAVAKRHAPTTSEESDEDDSYSDVDAEYGKPSAKRAKTGGKKRPSPKMKAGDDGSEDEERGSDNAIVKKEDADDDRVVAAGASFLALEKNVPASRQSSKKAEAKPSLIVSLPITGRGRAPVKKESSEEEEDEDSDSADSSQEDSEDEDAGEENAIQALATMSSKGKGSAETHADLSTAYTPYNNLPPLHQVMANSPIFDSRSPNNEGTVPSNYGGLPFPSLGLSDTNFSSNLDDFGFPNDSGEYAVSDPYGTVMYDSGRENGFRNGFSSYGDVSSLGDHRGVISNQSLLNNSGFFGSTHGMNFSNNAGFPNTDLHPVSVTNQPNNMSRGHAPGGNTSFSTLNPTPTSENGACALDGLPRHRDSIQETEDRDETALGIDDNYSQAYQHDSAHEESFDY